MVEIQQLQYAVEVERCTSISKAAEKLYVSQPFISKTIKALESDIGIEIFKRTSRGVVPTAKGEAFLAHAKEILASVEDLENSFQSQRTAAYHFEFAVPIACYISHAFVNFSKELNIESGIQTDYKETNSMNTIELLSNHECNLGIIRYPSEYESYFMNYLKSKDLKSEELWEFKYRLVLNKNNPIAVKKDITAADLKEMIEITHGDPSVPALSASELLERRHRKKGAREITVYERQSQFELLSQMENTYMWASPTPPDVLKVYPLIERDCSLQNNSCKDVLIWRNGYHITDGDRLFIKKIKETISELKKIYSL